MTDDQHRGDAQITVPAHVEDLSKLKGQYIRHLRNDRVYLILDVGKEGVTASRAEADTFGAPAAGEPHGITWAALVNLYNIMVHAHEISGGVK